MTSFGEVIKLLPASYVFRSWPKVVRKNELCTCNCNLKKKLKNIKKSKKQSRLAKNNDASKNTIDLLMRLIATNELNKFSFFEENTDDNTAI